MPNQLVAVLADPLLQKLLLLRPSAEAYQRIANWLSSVLQNVLEGDADKATLWEVLDVVREFVVQSKVSWSQRPPCICQLTNLYGRCSLYPTFSSNSLHIFSSSGTGPASVVISYRSCHMPPSWTSKASIGSLLESEAALWGRTNRL